MWIGWCFPQDFYVSNFPFSIFRVAIQNFRTTWETHLLWNQGIAGLPHFSASLLAAEWIFSISGRIRMVISSTLPQKCMNMPQLVTCVCPFSSCNFQGGPIGCNGQRQAGNCRVAEVLRSLRREVFSTFVASPQKELPKEGGRSSGMQINAMISLISSTCLVAELWHMIL